jgi:predicted nucleotidyltransferase
VNDRSAPARFVVLADDRGQVTVAATEGAARFEAAGHAVVVPAGQVTRAQAGQVPADPETIPEEIFLSVTWPTRESRDDDRIPIGGRVDPRSLVRVNGALAEPDVNGRFAAAVPVHDGTNPVEVEVEDISGRIRVEKRDVRKIPTRPPELEPIKTELWTP